MILEDGSFCVGESIEVGVNVGDETVAHLACVSECIRVVVPYIAYDSPIGAAQLTGDEIRDEPALTPALIWLLGSAGCSRTTLSDI